MTHEDFARMSKYIVAGDSGCWLWTGRTNGKDYAQTTVGSKKAYVYRVLYVYLKGSFPQGTEVDHLCRVRRCVNPAHIEPVTHQENMKRGKTISALNLQKSTCPQGHAYSGTNSRGDRICHPCYAEAARAYRLRKKTKCQL
jgi:HNH endonuclease